ncbi:unnamed protein product, partial [Heterosigma akashiwo]
ILDKRILQDNQFISDDCSFFHGEDLLCLVVVSAPSEEARPEFKAKWKKFGMNLDIDIQI